MNAFFSSLDSGKTLKSKLLQSLEYAEQLVFIGRVEIHIMIFAFTDVMIAKKIMDLAVRNDSLVVRIIADWNQGSEQAGRIIPSFIAAGIHNIEIRFKYDEPYIWDESAQCLRWSYHTSLGLLHHKTLCILMDGIPKSMITGSMNWTKNSETHYENMVALNDDCLCDVQVMNRFELEFRALWVNPSLTVSPEYSKKKYLAMVSAKKTGVPEIDYNWFLDDKHMSPFENYPQLMLVNDESCQVAFSSKEPFHAKSAHGYDGNNNQQAFYVTVNNGRKKKFQLSLQSLTLDTIHRAKEGDELYVAMYALSNRVAEYSALLSAARKGVHVNMLLDKKIGTETKIKINMLAEKEKLSLIAKTPNRRMHQKYLIHKNSFTVVTGSANMTRDAYERHIECRIRCSQNKKVTEDFLNDFFMIESKSYA